MNRIILTAIILFAGLSADVMAALSWSGTQHLDVPYKTVDGQTLLLDIYLPDTVGPSPVVMYTHGGGWSTGDKSTIEVGYKSWVALNLLEAGVAVVTVDYRLATDGVIIRDCITDSKDAYRFICKNADMYNIDKMKVAAFGDSAGAHIAMMCALTDNDDAGFPGTAELAAYTDYKIKGCVAWYGPTSFRLEELSFWMDRSIWGFSERLFGDETDADTQNYLRELVSPVVYFDRYSPPLYLMHGADDTTIPVGHAYGMNDLATAVGNASFGYQIVENSGHNFRVSDTLPISPTAEELATLATEKLLSYLDVEVTSSGPDYTWNGSAADGDWTNTANWDGGVAPTSLSASAGGDDPNTITFNGANMPAMNLATFTTGYSADSASMIFNSGGAFDLDFSTSQNSAPILSESRTLLTVGDGTGPTNDVVVNVSNMAMLLRHNSVTADYTVHADGVLNFDGNLETYQQDNKKATFTLNGGTVVAAGFVGTGVKALESIEFTALNGSFTAAYGGEFADFAAVMADANGLFVNNSGGILEKVDNGDATFTVSAIYSSVLADINASTNVGVAPLEITFDGSASTPIGDIVSYSWNFGDGSSNSGSVVSHTYTNIGTFVATLEVVDSSDTTNSTSAAITVGSPIVVDITASADHGQAPAEIIFDGSGSSASAGIVSYEWDFGDGTTNYGAIVTNIFDVGEYTVTLTVVDGIGDSNSATTNVQAWVMPENVDYSIDQPASAPAVSTNDLCQTDLLDITVENLHTGPISNLVDGIASTDNSTRVRLNSNSSVTMTFDTSVNALGYDITDIYTVYGASTYGGGRANQGYSVTVTYMDDSTEKILGKKTWQPNDPATFWTTVSFSNTEGGVIASGVKAITFAEFDGAVVGDQGFGYYIEPREFDVIGMPTTDISEPPVLGLSGSTLSWGTPIEKGYVVQVLTNLTTDTWLTYSNVMATPPETHVELPFGRADYEFFRVKVDNSE
ncbi:PKD domain-containing protein [Pontiellaceae bacterium B12219]|nr:PKD domain-containing protein [Pontiellaceae bacterium B12219]